jgi:hypothetical protein
LGFENGKGRAVVAADARIGRGAIDSSKARQERKKKLIEPRRRGGLRRRQVRGKKEKEKGTAAADGSSKHCSQLDHDSLGHLITSGCTGRMGGREEGDLGIGIWKAEGERRKAEVKDGRRRAFEGRQTSYSPTPLITDSRRPKGATSPPSFPRRRESRPPKAVMRPTHLIPYSLTHGTARCESPRRRERREKTLRDGGLLGPRPIRAARTATLSITRTDASRDRRFG